MQRPLQTLYAYWNELRAGRLAPERLEIEPARISAILPETFMLEWLEPRTFLYRLAGTRLCELLGTELRGTNFFARFEERVRRDLQRRLGPAAGEGAGMLLLVEVGADPAQRLELEVLLLPLLHGGPKVTRLIGAMSPRRSPAWPVGAAGRWRLEREELIWPDAKPRSFEIRESRERPPAPPRPGAGGEEGPTRIGATRHLRVLQGGRSDAKNETP
jgi:hypothetical protein